MPNLPDKIYLTRGEVINALGGRAQLRRAEAAGRLRRVVLPAYVRARYVHAEVKKALDDLRGRSS